MPVDGGRGSTDPLAGRRGANIGRRADTCQEILTSSTSDIIKGGDSAVPEGLHQPLPTSRVAPRGLPRRPLRPGASAPTLSRRTLNVSFPNVEPSPHGGLNPAALLSLLAGPRTLPLRPSAGARRFGVRSHGNPPVMDRLPHFRTGPTTHLGVELDPGELDRFYPLLRQGGEEALDSYLMRLLTRGISEARILLELLHPAAARLGEDWETDHCTFVEVTLGTGRLQRLVRRLTRRSGAESVPFPANRPRILLAAGARGQQHTLGIVMISEFFRKAGWEVDVGAPLRPEETSDLVARQSFHAVGISLALVEEAPRLRREVARIRRRSRNPAIGVLVGGAAVSTHPELVDEIGADASSPQAHLAPDVARAFL